MFFRLLVLFLSVFFSGFFCFADSVSDFLLNSKIEAKSNSDKCKATFCGDVCEFVADENFKSISFKNRNYLKLQFSDTAEVVVFSKDKNISVNRPIRKTPRVFVHSDGSSEKFEYNDFAPYIKDNKKNFVRVSTPSIADLLNYRNVALNPLDRQESSVSFYPHATALNFFNNKARFEPRNTIDGAKFNFGHSRWRHRSWGPFQVQNCWIKIDFGRRVKLDKICVVMRGDFPHDEAFRTGILKFSDGTEMPVSFEKTRQQQEIKFPSKETTSIELCKLCCTQPQKWYGFAEIEAWGSDVLFADFVDEKGKPKSFEDVVLSLRKVNDICSDDFFVWQCLYERYPFQTANLFEDLNGNSKALFDSNFVSNILSACKNAVKYIKYDNPKSTAKCKKYQDFKDTFIAQINNFKGDKKAVIKLYLDICKIRGEARGW